MGLLLSHKRKCRVAIDAVSFFPGDNCGHSGGGRRGEVAGFSAEARKRMIHMLHSVKFQTAVMVTLTYGADYPKEWKKWKANLKEWRRRFEFRYGHTKAIWRIELQKRAAPHFHILYLDMPFIPVDTLQSSWYDIIKTPPELRYGNGLDLKAVRGSSSHKQIMAYVSKYIGKVERYDDWEEKPKIGRIWGYWNLKEEPFLECELSEFECKEVAKRVMSMWAKNYYTPADLSLCTLFGEEMGSGEFMSAVRDIILAVSERSRGKFGKKVTFVTTNHDEKNV